MKRSLYTTGAILLIVAGAIGIASANLPAAGGWCMRHGPGRFPLAYLSRELNLTDSQRDQIVSIGKAELPRIRPLLRQLLDGLNEMPMGDANGSFDEVKARAVADQQAATLLQLLVERQRVISKIYNDVLTPEQRQKADELRQHMHHRAEGFLNGEEHPTD
jgi:Spy/CpxP family protein refolding chaperone